MNTSNCFLKNTLPLGDYQVPGKCTNIVLKAPGIFGDPTSGIGISISNLESQDASDTCGIQHHVNVYPEKVHKLSFFAGTPDADLCTEAASIVTYINIYGQFNQTFKSNFGQIDIYFISDRNNILIEFIPNVQNTKCEVIISDIKLKMMAKIQMEKIDYLSDGKHTTDIRRLPVQLHRKTK